MRGWSRIWWGTAALVVAAEALLLRLGQAQAVVRELVTTGSAGGSGAWFGRDVPGYDSFSRIVYGLPQAWSVVGLVLLAVGVALWRDSRVALVAAPLGLVTGSLILDRLTVTAALLATAALAVAAARSAPWLGLRLVGWVLAGAVLLLAVLGAGRAPSSVEVGSTAHLAGRAAAVTMLVVALLFVVVAAAPQPATGVRGAAEPLSPLHAQAWAVVAVAGAIQVALAGSVLVEHLHLVLAESRGTVEYVTVAIPQFTGQPPQSTAQPPPVDLGGYLAVVATLSAAAAAVAAILLRAVHPLVLAAVACLVLAVLPIGATARYSLALAGFGILAFVALREPRDDLG